MVRRSLAWAVVAALLGVLFSAIPANASHRYCYNGGPWSHRYHTGWHRYYGGPPVGYYYAPRPVYVVEGYSDPCYYRDRYAWDERPSFGVYVNLGGSRVRYVRNRPHYYRHRDYGYRPRTYVRYYDRW